MVRWLALVLVLLPAVGGGSESDEHTVWEDEEEAREALVEEAGEADDDLDDWSDAAPGRD